MPRSARWAVTLPTLMIDSIGSKSVVRKEFSYKPDRAGIKLITAKLPGDELEADNTAYLCLDVRGSTRVLVVDGKPDSIRPRKAESYQLKNALDPNGNGDWGFKVDVVTREILSNTRFGEYDVVCLMNLSDFPGQGDGALTFRT